jgi:hypothetical protein
VTHENFNQRIDGLEIRLRDALSDLDGVMAWAKDRAHEHAASEYELGMRKTATKLIDLIDSIREVRRIRYGS